MRRRPAGRSSSCCKKAEASGAGGWHRWPGGPGGGHAPDASLWSGARLRSPRGSAGCRRRETRRSGLPHGGMRALAGIVSAGPSRRRTSAVKAEPSRTRSRPSPAATGVASDLRLGPAGVRRRCASGQQPANRRSLVRWRSRRGARLRGRSPVRSGSRFLRPLATLAGRPRPSGSSGPVPRHRGGGAVEGKVPTRTPAVSAQGGRRRRSGMATGQAQASPSPRPGELVAAFPKVGRTARRGRKPQLHSEERPCDLRLPASYPCHSPGERDSSSWLP